eukprot:CAMPEP_0182530250 /NCGR_PEP_ID=MMETSP1323-20130603/5777_1 /TAXON_ID=236787 /ORGANISM="Florenciella parvula, Strain RCC1693" /LENGTH=84 /DNA_ID=CAMNT_0024739541 /DNA_START=35 /DNA_END=286 /DNA_ORIENTATION=-
MANAHGNGSAGSKANDQESPPSFIGRAYGYWVKGWSGAVEFFYAGDKKTANKMKDVSGLHKSTYDGKKVYFKKPPQRKSEWSGG